MGDKLKNILLTGGTGFLGKRLVSKFADRDVSTIFILCRKGSEIRLNSAFLKYPELKTRIRLLQGDITLPALGIDRRVIEELDQGGVEIVHCAAAYDLAVDRETALRVNLEGTRNALALAASMKSMHRFHHISTIIVSGDRTGTILEDELDTGQGFKNFYESSKFQAEKEVRKHAGEFPVTIYRPAVIIGDSVDGSTDKFDGPYFALDMMLRGLPIVLPGAGEAPLHLVPVDFVAEAIAEIASRGDTIGKTFHLCDHDPLSVKGITEKMRECLGTRTLILHAPIFAMRMIVALPFFSAITHMPVQMLPYMCAYTRYDTSNADAALQHSGITCPPIDTYFEKIVRFFKSNFGDARKAEKRKLSADTPA